MLILSADYRSVGTMFCASADDCSYFNKIFLYIDHCSADENSGGNVFSVRLWFTFIDP